ncbi:unnamed protein product [Pylaiella littoralis]
MRIRYCISVGQTQKCFQNVLSSSPMDTSVPCPGLLSLTKSSPRRSHLRLFVKTSAFLPPQHRYRGGGLSHRESRAQDSWWQRGIYGEEVKYTKKYPRARRPRVLLARASLVLMAAVRYRVSSAGAAWFRGRGGGSASPPPVEGTPKSTIRYFLLLVVFSVVCGCFIAARSSEWPSRGPSLQPKDKSLVEAVTVVAAAGGDHGDQLAAARALESFPTVANSTVMFLHVFKCAGTSLRKVFIEWATRGGWSGAVVEYCRNSLSTNSGRICLNEKNHLADPLRQRWLLKGTRVLAGHFLWDFRHRVTAPYLMITTLRNPLELFVSSRQYMHKAETRTLDESVAFVSHSMKSRLAWKNPVDLAFIRRFLDSETADSYDRLKVYPKETMQDWAQSAVEHLSTFYVVGVVEQYRGFIEVLERLLDPEMEYPKVWKTAVIIKNNGSPVQSSDVLRSIDPDLVREFNATSLSLQWQVYNAALQMWDQRCREVLPTEDHRDLCSVPVNTV